MDDEVVEFAKHWIVRLASTQGVDGGCTWTPESDYLVGSFDTIPADARKERLVASPDEIRVASGVPFERYLEVVGGEESVAWAGVRGRVLSCRVANVPRSGYVQCDFVLFMRGEQPTIAQIGCRSGSVMAGEP